MLEPGSACAEQRNLLGSHCWRLIFSRVAVWLFALAALSSGCWRSGQEVEEEVVEDDEEDFPYHSDSSAPDTMLNGGGLENCNFSPCGELENCSVSPSGMT